MYKITSKFHQQEAFRLKPHNGIDLKMEVGEPLRSIKEGVVRTADYGSTNAGKTVFVEWEDGKTAIYGHLSEFAVKNGQQVEAGDLIGYAGNTGHSTGSHLHFGLKEGSEFIDPTPYIDSLQHMNDVGYFVQSASTKFSFLSFFQQHMSLYTDMKMHLINIFSTDYMPFIKLFQNVIQLIFFNI
ncbi:metalloendopeptidase-like membrane protein [Peribacillus asahii]|uniref:Metalloendopeptidase-like membrane protein n=1 Tax=Peribacillus asahii TaxID=228899 RepID=A0A3T0KU28_9BACI|nr:M23 family metallopeptidase [Peribacillus asahii]AZV43704.1 metalloendopeptidase-like membrane protein [Peribacillus asahii]